MKDPIDILSVLFDYDRNKIHNEHEWRELIKRIIARTALVFGIASIVVGVIRLISGSGDYLSSFAAGIITCTIPVVVKYWDGIFDNNTKSGKESEKEINTNYNQGK